MRLFLSILIFFTLASCSKDDHIARDLNDVPKAKLDFRSIEDLDAMRDRGVVRLIAPRFDGADALPRDGIPVLDYQQLAEEFVQSEGLAVKWVFVDGFSALIPALLDGRGDVIVTNMTVTNERRKSVDFTRQLAQVAELVISRKDFQISSVEALSQVSLTIAAGTSYAETLNSLGLADSIVKTTSEASDSDLLDSLRDGSIQATVLDSDIARKLLPAYPELDVDLQINKHRSIAWAVRKTNPVLLQRLNEFLVSHHVSATALQKETRDWEAIKQSGRLRMLTLNNPASYFMWRGELMGFDYELLRKFASDNDLHLSVVIRDGIPDLFDALASGEGDVIAASITRTVEREALGVSFSRPYLYVTEQLVGRREGPRITSFDEIEGHSIGVNPSTVFYQRLQQQAKIKNTFEIVDMPNTTTEALIAMLSEEAFDFTVADSHLVNIEQTYHDDIVVNFDLTEKTEIAWGVRTEQSALLGKLNSFIKSHYRGLFYNVIVDKYFKNTRKIKRFQGGRVETNGSLSPYDDLLQTYANKYNMDWRLLTAQMYQESKFNPKAKSFAGAMGLMQVMPRTAREFGYEDLLDPESSIAVGVEYMHWLEQRFPGELDFQERIYFTLAAYNAGTGHVRDARRLAGQLGLNPNKWFGHVEQAMLKLSQPKYYQASRFGYVRGHEPVAYVRDIRDRYLSYLGISNKGMPESLMRLAGSSIP